MLHQTQVARVAVAYDQFLAQFPTPRAMAAAGPGAVIAAWGRLGYPRRARRLWESAVRITDEGWPSDLAELPGIMPKRRQMLQQTALTLDQINGLLHQRPPCPSLRGLLGGYVSKVMGW